MPERSGLLLATDLDGTLLDHVTYSAEAAAPALAALRARAVPVVLCSSKTRVEMRAIADSLRLTDPLVAENGSVVVWSKQHTAHQPAGTIDDGDEWLLPLGERAAALRGVFERLREALGLAVVAVDEVGVETLAEWTGLPLETAARARQREWTVTFLPTTPLSVDHTQALRAAAAHEGLTLTRGGRFHHLHGGAGKGPALAHLRRWYERAQGKALRLIALGDAPNDADLLALADVPIIVPAHDPALTRMLLEAVPHARLAPAPGPRGWNEAVLTVLAEEERAAEGREA